MESKAVQSTSRFDALKWLVVFVLIAVGVVGNQYFSAESVLYRVLALVGLGLVAAFVALQTERGRRFATLLKEARVEIRKVGAQGLIHSEAAGQAIGPVRALRSELK